MDPIPGKYFFMKRLVIAMSLFMLGSASNICAKGREVSVSLHDSTDDSVKIMIYRGEADPVTIAKNQTYMVKVASAVHLNVFGKDQSQSVRHPINPSTTSVVLKPTQGDGGLRVEVVEHSFLSSLYSLFATTFLLSKE
jgi:hypothetical protein